MTNAQEVTIGITEKTTAHEILDELIKNYLFIPTRFNKNLPVVTIESRQNHFILRFFYEENQKISRHVLIDSVSYSFQIDRDDSVWHLLTEKGEIITVLQEIVRQVLYQEFGRLTANDILKAQIFEVIISTLEIVLVSVTSAKKVGSVLGERYTPPPQFGNSMSLLVSLLTVKFNQLRTTDQSKVGVSKKLFISKSWQHLEMASPETVHTTFQMFIAIMNALKSRLNSPDEIMTKLRSYNPNIDVFSLYISVYSDKLMEFLDHTMSNRQGRFISFPNWQSLTDEQIAATHGRFNVLFKEITDRLIQLFKTDQTKNKFLTNMIGNKEFLGDLIGYYILGRTSSAWIDDQDQLEMSYSEWCWYLFGRMMYFEDNHLGSMKDKYFQGDIESNIIMNYKDRGEVKSYSGEQRSAMYASALALRSLCVGDVATAQTLLLKRR